MIELFYATKDILIQNDLPILIQFYINMVLWILIIIFCLILISFIIYLFYNSSKNPVNWSNLSFKNDEYNNSIFEDLSKNIRSDKKLKQYNQSIKELMQMMFFHKIESYKKISTEELMELKKNNPKKLYEIIKDDELYNWILNIQESKKGLEKKKKILNNINKQKYLKEINGILNKMEVWEK